MNTAWDYTKLAAAYVKRPEYAESAIQEMYIRLGSPRNVCDIGAGDGHLTIELSKLCANVTAVEPNDAMRENGIKKTIGMANVKWHKGTGESTGQADGTFDAVTFGSSFNVCDQIKALEECKRITKPHGTFACLWNHRDLNDPIQSRIEEIILKTIPNYDYGNRRQDQTQFLTQCGFLTNIHSISGEVIHKQNINECIEAWRSHGTLHRQCKTDNEFNQIITEIEAYLHSLHCSEIKIPYVTRIWTGQLI